MNIIKHDSFKNNKKEKENFKKLPYIQKKINPIRTVLESSSQSYSTLFPKKTNFYFNPRRSQGLPKEKNINTKLYKVNDYLSMTNKDMNSFNNLNMTNRTRNKKEINNLKNNRSDIKQETAKAYTYLYRNSSTGNYNISTAASLNNKLNLNLFNNKSNIFNNDSTSNQTINNFNMYNNNNIDVIKKLNDYNLNLLKKSRYFSKTKYINGIKNKIKENQKHINKSLSTKNISLENTHYNSARKTFNEMIVGNLMDKHQNIDEYKKVKNNEDNNMKKKQETGVNTDTTKINSAIFYDFIPIILQHMKQKETLDEINKEQENIWLYDKMNNIFNTNSTEGTKGNFIKNKKNILENPIIKYLFLERTLYNLRHTVKFVDIKNREEFEEKVLKVMGEEYAKLENKQNIYDIHDFITYGFELDPKFFINLKQFKRQINLKNSLLADFNKMQNKKEELKLSLSHYKTRTGGFFTTNKSDFKTDENKNNNDSNNKSRSEGVSLLNKIMVTTKIPNKIRKFEGLQKNEKKISIIKKPEENKDKNNNINDKDKKAENENNKMGNIYLDINNLAPNIGFSKLAQELLEDDSNENVKNYNTIKINEKFNPNRNHIDLYDITHIVNDVQTKDKMKKKHGNKYLKIYSVKKKKPKKKKKVEKSKSSEKEEEIKEEMPKIDFDLIKSTIIIPKQEEIKKEEPKKEIKSKFDYERYKKEKIKEIELDKKSKSKIFDALKKQDVKRPIQKKNSMLNEIFYSSNYNDNKSDDIGKFKKFEKIKKIEEKKNEGEREEGEDIITQLKKLKKKEKENEEGEQSESIFSSDDEEMEELDMSKDMENNGDIMKKKWMDNSPKFKNRIIDFNRRRMGISNESHEMFDELIKNEKIESLNDKMKKLYDKIDKKRKSVDSKKKRKKRIYTFVGVDLSSIQEIEKKKKIFLNRIKEDIKYKINEGKYHMIEMDNFKNFEEAMNKFKLKSSSDEKKVKLYINLVEKYLHFYQTDLDKKEKEKMDEDRINRFIRNLKQEIYITLPYVKEVQGRYCHSVDYFKELQELSEYHGF